MQRLSHAKSCNTQYLSPTKSREPFYEPDSGIAFSGRVSLFHIPTANQSKNHIYVFFLLLLLLPPLGNLPGGGLLGLFLLLLRAVQLREERRREGQVGL